VTPQEQLKQIREQSSTELFKIIRAANEEIAQGMVDLEQAYPHETQTDTALQLASSPAYN
jgi:hypothetical protein